MQVELSDLLPAKDAITDWEEQLVQRCPAMKRRNGERPSDIVPACPLDPDSPDPWICWVNCFGTWMVFGRFRGRG